MTNWNRRLLISAAAIAALLGAGGVAWQYARGAASETAHGQVVITIAPFRVVGAGTEPWSGLGLAEEVRLALAKMPGIDVRSADSASAEPAHYALAGTVSRASSRSEIGVEVARVNDRTVIWTGTFWRTPADLTLFAAELADAVVQAVRLDEKRAILAREQPR